MREPEIEIPKTEQVGIEPESELVVEEPEPEPEPFVEEPEPEPVVVKPEPEPEPEPEPKPDPVVADQVIFRIQFLSRSNPNSMSEVTIDGRRYLTYEYYYKGAYRITAGEFTILNEALAFRTRCKAAGYNQAFVAAFRNNERELDPSVFKR